MNQESNNNELKYNNNNGSIKIMKITTSNINLKNPEAIPTKNIQEKKIVFDNQSFKKIQLIRGSKKSKKNYISNLYKDNPKYKFIIKKIAKKLGKRVNFPKCKLFKIYLAYRTLILRIAKGIKKTAKKLNFWEKWENSITEQEVNQIQEIAFTACKIIQENGKKQFYSSDRNNKNKKNIKIGLSLFRKTENKNIVNSNDDKSETQKVINLLKNMNTRDNNFIDNFSNFLSDNNVEIFPDTKLPNITNNKYIYLLKEKEFWIKYIIYISTKYKNDLSIYNLIIFIEQFYIWNNNSITEDFNIEIIKAIKSVFDNETINKFLSANKINSLNDLFLRYKIIHTNYKYKEVKLDINNNKCQCPSCTDNGFVNKIIEYNKKNNIISYSKDNNISFININDNEKSNKYYDVELFDYLNKIEKRKTDEDMIKQEKKSRNSSNKKKSDSKNQDKKRYKSNSNRKKNHKIDKIQEIYDLLSIDVDLENFDKNDGENDKESSTNENEKIKIRKKKQYP